MDNMKQEHLKFENSPQATSFAWLCQAVRKIHVKARKALNARMKKEAAEKKRAELQAAHPIFSQTNYWRSAVYILMLVILMAVFSVDYLLLAGTTEFLAQRILRSPLMIQLTCVLGPAMVLILEAGVGMQLWFARQRKAETEEWVPYVAWLTVGLLLALVMPSLAVATALASQPDVTDATIKDSFFFQTASLAILAFVGHVLVLFGGECSHEAKAYFPFQVHYQTLKVKIWAYGKSYAKRIEEMVDLYRTYLYRFERHQQAYPEPPLKQGPFDEKTRILINEQYGGSIIPAPRGGEMHRSNGFSSSRNSATSEQKIKQSWTTPPPAADRDRENPSLSRILSLHLRDQKEAQERDEWV